ncbi:PilN domain-containing protein [Thiohalorhabdus sp.]|uniref:PilN domain-containing protein n=1 Tax=Thiohalorhabdus sp. TaxID=3094134 RepID=UPI002FC276B4
MIRINLLPYREFRRRAQIRRDGIGIAVFLVIVGGLLTAAYFHLQRVEQRHQARVTYMEDALDRIEDKLAEVNQIKEKRQGLIRKLEVIQQLQDGRELSTNILQTLGQAVPEEVSLSGMEQTDNGLNLEGDARDNNAVSSFMRRLEASTLFRNPDLRVIRGKDDGEAVKSFTLAVSLARGDESGQAEGGG